jgi:hypothetical protein
LFGDLVAVPSPAIEVDAPLARIERASLAVSFIRAGVLVNGQPDVEEERA